jgi:DNA-binding transcriptional ArsR family regulator
MLAFVPVTFDVYRPLKPRLRWAMQCLVSFADHAGRCFPSLRTFAQHAGISKSAAGRDLAKLAAAGLITRKRRRGGVYLYRIDRRFLPKWAPRKLSQARDGTFGSAPIRMSNQLTRGVPSRGTEEKPDKKNQGWARGRAEFARPRLEDVLPRQIDWTPRVQSWARSRFWLSDWGPRPNEPGCWAPPILLAAT